MAGLTPIDFSLLGQQRSDISKVAGDDFLKIQQQQLASVMHDEQELQKGQTLALEEKGLVEVDAEQEGASDQQSDNNKKKDKEGNIATQDEYSYVEYDDPDIGKVGEWLG